MTTLVEVAILGGGCAGLSLARQLLASPSAPETVVIEQRTSYENDRTWCFWTDGSMDLDAWIEHRWPRWRFSREGLSHVMAAAGWNYACIPAGSYYRRMNKLLERHRSVRLWTGTRVLNVEPLAAGFRIDTDRGTILADRVVDTRPPPRQRLDASCLLQVFVGWEVEFETAVADPDCVGLMESLDCDVHGFRFDYVVPFSERRVLIEATRFSRGRPPVGLLQADLESAVERIAAGSAYRILRRERGTLPMGLPPLRQPESGWVRGGISGGAVRPSTGYAFLRIQKWANACAVALLRGENPVPHPVGSPLVQWMDRLFLSVLQKYPERGPELFMRLAERVPAKRLVRFLSDRGRPADHAAVIRSLPAVPFLLRAMQSASWNSILR